MYINDIEFPCNLEPVIIRNCKYIEDLNISHLINLNTFEVCNLRRLRLLKLLAALRDIVNINTEYCGSDNFITLYI